MDTSAISSLGTGGSNLVSGSTATLGKEDFLKLLVAQLSHQDPLQPMQNTEFVSQLSQFSSLEQLMSVNSNLGLLQMGQAAVTNSQVAGLIGREVEAKGDVLQLAQSGSAGINFDLSAAAKEVTITIRNDKGEIVRTLAGGSRGPGVNSTIWDGRDASGNLMPPGSYQVEVGAKDDKGGEVQASTRFRGVVSGVTYAGGVPLLEIGTATVRVGDVIAIRLPGGATNGSR